MVRTAISGWPNCAETKATYLIGVGAVSRLINSNKGPYNRNSDGVGRKAENATFQDASWN